MSVNSGFSEEDRLLVFFVAVLAVGVGAASLGGMVESIRPNLIEWRILAEGDDIIIPFGDEDFGLGPVPILVLGGLLAIIVVMIVARSRRRRRIK